MPAAPLGSSLIEEGTNALLVDESTNTQIVTEGPPPSNPGVGTFVTDEADASTLIDEDSLLPLVDEGLGVAAGVNIYAGITSPTSTEGAALTNQGGDTLVDEETLSGISDEGLGIRAGRTTFSLKGSVSTVPAQDITVFAGENASLRIALFDYDGSLFDASAATITWTCGAVGGGMKFVKTSLAHNQIEIVGNDREFAIVHLKSEDTALSPGSGPGELFLHVLRVLTVDRQSIAFLTGVMTIIRIPA
jgi:hypothetical protein